MADGRGGMGDIAPHNPELERTVLGGVLLTGKLPAKLSAGDFWIGPNREAYELLAGLAEEGRPVDLETAMVELAVTSATRNWGLTVTALASMPNACPSPEGLTGWVRELRRLTHQRRLWQWSLDVRAAAADRDFVRLAQLQKAAPKEREDGAEPAGRPGGDLPTGEPEREVRAVLRRMAGRSASARTMAAEVLRTDTRWKGRLWFDNFRKIQMIGDRIWSDSDDQRVSEWLSRVYRVEISGESLRPICTMIADDNRRDPLTEYLRGLVWDGTERIGSWLLWGMGATDTPINRWIGQAWLVQAVARALRPGCQADATLVLLGEQGEGKTSTLRELVGAFWSESKIDIGNVPRCYQQAAAAWVHELGEMAQFLGSRMDQNEAKNFLTSPVDRFIPLHARATVYWERRCVFVGTTNRPEVLRDPTGARRFWPVEVGVAGPIRRAEVVALRDQLWAEAVHRYDAGDQYWLDKSRWGELRSVQADYQQSDPWAEAVEQWIGEYARVTPTGNGIPVLTALDGGAPVTTKTLLIAAIGRKLDAITQQDANRIGDVLTGLGYRTKKVHSTLTGKTINGIVKKSEPTC